MEKNNLSFGYRTNRLLFLWIIVFLIIILCVDFNSSNHLSSVRGSRNSLRQSLGGISSQRRAAITRSLNQQRQILRANSQSRGRLDTRRLSQNCIPGSICRTATSSRRRNVQNPRLLSDVRRIIASRRRSSQPSSSRGASQPSSSRGASQPSSSRGSSQPSSSRGDSGLSLQGQLGNNRGPLSLGSRRRTSRVQPANSVRQSARNRLLRQNANQNLRRQNGGSETQNNRVTAIPRQEVDSRLNALETLSNVLPKTIGNLINSFRSSSGGTPAIGLGIGIGGSGNRFRDSDRTISQQPQQTVPNSDQPSLQQSMDRIRQTFIRSRLENSGNRKQTSHPLQSPNSIMQIPEPKPLPAPPVVSNQAQTIPSSPNAITFEAPALDQGQFMLDPNGQFSQQGGMQQISINGNMNGNVQNGMNSNINSNQVVRNLNNQGLMGNSNNNVFQQSQTQVLGQNLNTNQQNVLGPGPSNQIPIGINSGNNFLGPSGPIQNINLQTTNLQNNLIPGTEFIGTQGIGPVSQDVANSQNQIIGLQNNFNQNVAPVGPNQIPSIGIQTTNQFNTGQGIAANNMVGSSSNQNQFIPGNTQINTVGQTMPNSIGQMMPGQILNVPTIQGNGQNSNVQFLQGQVPFSQNQNFQGQVQFSQNQNTQGKGQMANVPSFQAVANNQLFQGQISASNMQGTQNVIQQPMMNTQNQNNIGMQGQIPSSTGFQGIQNNQIMQNQLTFTNTPVGPRPMAPSPQFNTPIETSNMQNFPNSNVQIGTNQVLNMNQNSIDQGIWNNENQNQMFFGNLQISNQGQTQMGSNQLFPAQPTVIVGQGPATAGFQEIPNQIPFANQLGSSASQSNGAVLGTLQTANGGFGPIQNIPTLMPNAQFAPVTTNAPFSTTPKRVVIAVDPKSKGIKIVPDGNGGVKVIHLRHAITATPWNETNVFPTTTAMPIAPDTLARPNIKNISDPELLRKLERTDRINTTDIPEELEINGTSYDGTYHNPIVPGGKGPFPAHSQNNQNVLPTSRQANNNNKISDPELLRKLERTDRVNTTDIPEELEINGTSYDGTYHNPIIPGGNHPPQTNSEEVAPTQIQETVTASSVEAEETTLMTLPAEELEELEEMLGLTETTTPEVTTRQTTTTVAPPVTEVVVTEPPVTDIAITNLASANANSQKQGNSFTLVKEILSSNHHHKAPEQGKVNLKEHLIKIMGNSGGFGKPGFELKIVSLPKRDTKYIMDYRPR